MALWSRPEPQSSEPAADGEFLGRTAEEALDAARRALGPTAELRCWKTRRGGIGGFFATEVFVASVNPPAGALAAASKGRRRRTPQAPDDATTGSAGTTAPPVADGPRDVGAGGPHVITPVGRTDPPDPHAPAGPAVPADPTRDDAPPMVTYERPARAPRATGDDMTDSLAALADGKTDQLSLNFDAIPSHSFDEVLAEAEAAVAGVTAWSDRPGPSVRMVVSPPDEAVTPPDAGSPDAESAPTDGGSSAGRGGADDASEGDTPSGSPAPDPDASAPADRGATGDAATPGAGPDGAAVQAAAPAERRRRTRPKGTAAPRTPKRPATPAGPAAAAEAPLEPQLIPDLFERLQALGVPADHLPEPAGTSLDGVARSLTGLPEAPPLPTAPGAVIAVVGTAAAVARTTRMLCGEAPFRHGPRPDPSRRAWSPEDRTQPDRPLDDVLQEGDPLEVAGRVARRRLDGRPSLVHVEVVPGQPMRSHDRTVIASVQPDYVLGAIDASVKRADVVQWRDDLGMVDAIALWGLDGTVSPAELLGVLPVAFVDGVPGTPVAWTLHLLHRAADGAG